MPSYMVENGGKVTFTRDIDFLGAVRTTTSGGGYDDNVIFSLGTDSDIALLNRSTILNANTALTSVMIGTPVTPAVAANSLILSNVTASGDILLAANLSGNSQAWLWVDSSASLMTLYAAGVSSEEHGASGVVFNEGSADRDFRIESNDVSSMFVLDGALNVIGIGAAAVANQTVTITNATLNATAGRLTKFTGTVSAGNFGDGYGAVEVDVTSAGAQAGHVAALSAWLNLGADYTNASQGNFVQAMNVGVWCPSGRTLTNSKIIMGMRMSCVVDDGANPGSLFLFSTNIFDNTLTALFDVNAIADLGGSSTAASGNDYKIPLVKDATAGQVWYVNLYHA